MIYKQTKNMDELIEYLKNDKKIVFEKIDEDKAKKILLLNNYINVITPFKFKYAKFHRENIGTNPYKDISNKHIYETSIDFNEYYNDYVEERKAYSQILSNIFDFETIFKSISSHTLLLYLRDNNKPINNKTDLINFVNECHTGAKLSRLNGYNFNMEYLDYRYDQILANIEKFDDLFVFLDHLNLGDWEVLLAGLDPTLGKHLHDTYRTYKINLDSTNLYDFLIRFKLIREFRNCIAHRNSLQIFVRYRNSTKRSLRPDTERKKYERMWKKLKKPLVPLDILDL